VFATQTQGYAGQPIVLALISASDTRIVRHVRIKADANPFDPAWDSYFAQRQAMRMLERLQGRGFPKRLWLQQSGLCPGCGLPIVEDDRWVIQPLIPLKSGGARTLANLKMLHPTCLRSFRVVAGKASGNDHRVPAP
jgi:RNA-directed DNA polymerase